MSTYVLVVTSGSFWDESYRFEIAYVGPDENEAMIVSARYPSGDYYKELQWWRYGEQVGTREIR